MDTIIMQFSLQLKNLAWIQCDNPDCRKWRKIPNELLKNIAESDKWFCHQNRDPAFSSCSVPEEDVQWYDQMADRSGLKYLKSQLSPGDVVWAKMDGYCSWPSVVTAEPGTGSGHLSKYEDGEIAFYHVEFLGQPHSHGWVNTKHITVFTPASVGKQQVSNVSHKKQGRGRKSKGSGRKGSGRKHKTFCIQPAQKLKTAYKTGVCVEDGISEALTMLPLSPSKRLDMCTYVQALPESDSAAEPEEDIASDSLREMLQTLEESSKLDSPLLMAATKGKGTSKGEASSSSQQVLHALENVGQTSPQPNEQCPQNSQLLQVVPSATDNADGDSSAQRKRDDNSSAFSQQLRQNLSVLQEAMSLIDHQMD
ncbi:hypothetical protein ACOMHN_047673 [Nucella lapillus]